MLKISSETEAGVLLLALEGKLVGPWVAELERCWRSAVGTEVMQPVFVDLTRVTFINDEGKELLSLMYRNGAELIAAGCLTTCIVEGITGSGSKKTR